MNNKININKNKDNLSSSSSSQKLLPFSQPELQKQNKQLIHELTTLTRNYEALSLKHKDQSNLIKRLQDELSTSNLKENKLELQNEINTYKSKYEELLSSFKSLESKYQTTFQNGKKYQENEVKYKLTITKLENRLKNIEKLDNQDNQNKKQNEQSMQILIEENKKMENLLNTYKKENITLSKQAEEINKTYEDMKKENELIYKLLQETREKLKINDKLLEELSKKIHNKSTNNNNDNKDYKSLYNDIIKEYNELKLENEKLKANNSHLNKLKRNFTSNLQIHSMKPLTYLTTSKHSTSFNKEYFTEYLESTISAQMNQIQIKANKSLDLFEHKLKLIISKCFKLQHNDKDQTIHELYNKQLQHINNIKELTNKINKIKIKKKTLKIENITLSQSLSSLKEKQLYLVDMTEIQKLFTYIKSIIDRLKLTMETFSLNLNCKICYEMKSKLMQLHCGHTICEDCFKMETTCIECGNNFTKTKCVSNLFTEHIIARYKYAQQQIESDIDLVISTLNDNFNKKNSI